MLFQLVIVGGKYGGRVIPLRTLPFRIGRSRACDLRPKTSSISRQHCELREHRGMLQIRDLGSRNGTFVDRQRIDDQWRQLHHDQILRMGKLQVRVAIVAAPSAQLDPGSRQSQGVLQNASYETLLAELDHLAVQPDASTYCSETSEESPPLADTAKSSLVSSKAAHVTPPAPEAGFQAKLRAARPIDSQDAAKDALKKLFRRE